MRLRIYVDFWNFQLQWNRFHKQNGAAGVVKIPWDTTLTPTICAAVDPAATYAGTQVYVSTDHGNPADRGLRKFLNVMDGFAGYKVIIFDGRPYQRVETTTSRMPQERYESLLLDRMHARRRWENQPAVGVRMEDLDAEEILRTREDAVRHRHISAGTSMDVGDILDRLGLRIDGVLTQAAQMLYGTRFLPDYPQARLKLGRFRGSKMTGDILDNKQEYLHAFAIVREAMAFLDRTLPLSGHFVEGRIQREDRLPVPPDALREVLLNAVMHRDYSHPGGDVAVAIFDDRIEIWSSGSLPPGITVEALSGPHKSILRNPLIAGTFHRREAYLDVLVAAGWLEMTIPDKPTSPRQRYRTTEAGKKVLSE
jgi:hypothetical protein